MNRQGVRRWPLWRRVTCIACGFVLVPASVTAARAYTCGCGLTRAAEPLELRVLAACRAEASARTGGMVRQYILETVWSARTTAGRAALLTGLAALVATNPATPIEVLQLPTAVCRTAPAPFGAALTSLCGTVPCRTRRSRRSRRTWPYLAWKETPCRSTRRGASSQHRRAATPNADGAAA